MVQSVVWSVRSVVRPKHVLLHAMACQLQMLGYWSESGLVFLCSPIAAVSLGSNTTILKSQSVTALAAHSGFSVAVVLRWCWGGFAVVLRWCCAAVHVAVLRKGCRGPVSGWSGLVVPVGPVDGPVRSVVWSVVRSLIQSAIRLNLYDVFQASIINILE